MTAELPQPIDADALVRRVLAAISGPVATEQIPLVEGLDRVLAEGVVSAIDLPPWDASAVDGFAVRSADTASASPANTVALRIVRELRPGAQPDVALGAGEAARVAAGTPLPAGADAVVAIGSAPLAPGEGTCPVTAPVAAGENVRPRGADVTAGTEVLTPGASLRPAQLGLAGAIGEGSLCVYRRPIAGILSTGDEVRFPGQGLGAAGVPDANRPGLLTRCRQAGVWAVDLGIAGDSFEAVSGALASAVERADVIVTTGGVGTPPYDVVRRVFESLGTAEAWRLEGVADAPVAFGATDRRQPDGRRCYLFGLPGNPAAAFLAFELVVAAALDRLAGRAEGPRPEKAVLEAEAGAFSPPVHLGVVAIRDEQGRPARDERGRVRVAPANEAGLRGVAAVAAVDAVATVRESTGAGAEVEIRWLAR